MAIFSFKTLGDKIKTKFVLPALLEKRPERRSVKINSKLPRLLNVQIRRPWWQNQVKINWKLTKSRQKMSRLTCAVKKRPEIIMNYFRPFLEYFFPLASLLCSESLYPRESPWRQQLPLLVWWSSWNRGRCYNLLSSQCNSSLTDNNMNHPGLAPWLGLE